MKLKRDVTKYIRDGAKSAYQKDTECRICGTTNNLDFHHFYTISHLVNKYMKENNLRKEDVLEWRENFIEVHHAELYDKAITLCHDHHLKLHSIYGRDPVLATAPKQERWVNRQREKHGTN